jgi:glutathione-independent formaldehyde dehydrogenase
VDKVPDAEIEKPTDVVVRITTTNICGSDLHMYEGRTSFEPGQVFGHENLGEVIEVGKGVDRVKKGDLVCLPSASHAASARIASADFNQPATAPKAVLQM